MSKQLSKTDFSPHFLSLSREEKEIRKICAHMLGNIDHCAAFSFAAVAFPVSAAATSKALVSLLLQSYSLSTERAVLRCMYQCVCLLKR